MGDPKKILVNVENKEDGKVYFRLTSFKEEGEEAAAAEEEEDEEGAAKDNASDKTEEEEIKIPPKNLTEIDRLAYIVRSIEDNC